MNAGQLAALIAAVFFAVLACAGIVVLVKLSRLMSAVTGMVSEYRDRADRGEAQPSGPLSGSGSRSLSPSSWDAQSLRGPRRAARWLQRWD